MPITKGAGKKKGKKGAKKRASDPFLRKEWYEVKAPNMFQARQVGYTLVNKTQGTKIASDALKGRVYEFSLADLQKDEDQGHRKIRLRCEDVQGRALMTQFHGMCFTTDKLRSLVRKWHTLIEANVDVRTSDGYTLRLFCIGLTKRRMNQIKRTTYAQSSQIRSIRAKMVAIMKREANGVELKDLVAKFIPESIGKQIEKECQGIYPLTNVYIRKCKVLKTPKFDAFKMAELYTDSKEDAGKTIAAAAAPAEGEAAAAPAETTLVGE